jgi:pimeloyl-ACP methyl ester carboxylesterase
MAEGQPHLAIETFGRADDPALLLVMGATASRGWWPEKLCQGLAARGLFVIRYDNRDTGQSATCPPGAANYSVEDLADDVVRVLDRLWLASAHVMGMSLGGYLAQMAALGAPGRIRSLVLFASEPLGWTGQDLPGIADGFMELFVGFGALDWGDVDAVVGFQLPQLRFCAGPAFPFDAAASEAMLRAEYARAINPASAFNHGSVQSVENWSGAVYRLQLPVLVVHGTADPILPIENGRALAKAIPSARLVELEGVGHEIPAGLVPMLVKEIADFTLGIPA